MMISTKGRYALRMLLDIGEQQKEDACCVPLSDIAARQNISRKYLEQIAPRLAHAGILQVERGSKGGYCLTRPLSEITMGEVLRVMEGSLAPVPCVGEDSSLCVNCDEGCKMHPVWVGLNALITRYVDGINLAQILEQGNEI